jgi:hypothetical protein
MERDRINNDIFFNSKADAVPYNYRISYKVSLVCLIIGKCCGKKGCSAIKLQMINAAVNTANDRKELLALTKQITNTAAMLIRFDPSISRAINYAIADNHIFRQGNGLFRLTEKGKCLMTEIYNNQELMIIEKEFFLELSNKLTENIVEGIAQTWRMKDA